MPAQASQPANASPASDPYCGVYCLYSAAKLEGLEPELTSLIDPAYIGSREGSSLPELALAAKRVGLHTSALEGLSVSALRASPYRMLLHVKQRPEAKPYRHWVLFCGLAGRDALIIDPPECRRESLGMLASGWDGVALVVSRDPVSLRWLWRSQALRWGSAAAAVLAAGLIARTLKRRLFRFSRHQIGWRPAVVLCEMGVLLVVACLLGAGRHQLADDGFFSHPEAVAAVKSTYEGTFIPRLTLQAARRLQKEGAIFVDARLESDFAHAHISGAISIPVDADAGRWQTATSAIEKDRPIVVYCQSRGCPFAETVALRLMHESYTVVHILEGGWKEWSGK